ncbi:MoaD/ThiS family protein [Yersinia kristensenii]|uniref:MoaD/ThiS family protein n=1 Tax=Yersinia kristensenii TaxID=28152 RepID=UPI000B6EED73|nr:MoaD/ThiS family protein [Yersinia kristensenii]MBW5814963.1 MoaD/ThiS family protein [Yersinia kristensenii]MBW5840499.1 MoaD/ThiS family protein [Yersinia kristensenii]OWF86007.1 molybdopterin synthase sulfur carrier subunit [Yersinia kristensenii]
MAVTLLIPSALRAFTDGQGKVSLEGENVGELVAALAEHYPDIRQHLYEDDGSLRSFINLYVGDANIKTTGGLGTPVNSGDEVILVPAIAGGAGARA